MTLVRWTLFLTRFETVPPLALCYLIICTTIYLTYTFSKCRRTYILCISINFQAMGFWVGLQQRGMSFWVLASCGAWCHSDSTATASLRSASFN
ncbi:hypothetical protein BDZ89DRAFT_458831 [Hymenopellis radicata]|nr:hypothetical protein BDZ89DRAFT_458831 [Hymenopellis radicata]